MSLFDKFRKQLGQNPEKVDRTLDKAAKKADQKTQGKYSQQIQSGTQKAKETSRRQAKGGDHHQGGGQGGDQTG